MSEVLPPRLRPGDRIAVPVPAGPVQAARLEAGLARLRARYQVSFADDAMTATGYLAGDDDRRAAELNRYLRDPDVRAIICARGGYGLMRIIDRLDAAALRADPKILVGFSDATALLGWARAAGVRGIHGPMAAQLGDLAERDAEALYRMMESPAPAGRIDAAFAPLGGPGAGSAEGPLLGGNLSLLAHLVATPAEIPLRGAILFVEDIGERPYAIDRYLTRMGLAGRLAGVAAALAGDFTGCEETRLPPPQPGALDVVGERLRHHGIAGLAGLPIGHGTRNLALPFGGRTRVDFAARTVTLLEAAVS
jgi:muramoyltetrapeptide carboxypeptidase